MSDGAEEISEILVSLSRNNLLHIVGKLQILDRLFLVGELLVPAGLADRGAHGHEIQEARIVAQEVGVHVHDELPLERVGPLLGHRRR